MPYSKTFKMLQVRRFMPFSVGPRDCIGQNLAKVNYQTTVPMLLSNFSFELAEEVPNCPLCCSGCARLLPSARVAGNGCQPVQALASSRGWDKKGQES